MPRPPAASAGARPHVLVILLLVGLALRLPGLFVPSLWFDEIYGATFAALGPIDTVVAALRFDVHPPLYYLQLSLWGTLGSSDAWLYANSLAFSLASIALLYVAATRVFDGRVGALAAGWLALSPPDLLYAQSVRMYAMLLLLSIASWWANHRLAHGWSGWRASAAVLGIALTLTYSHGLGFFMASFFALYSLLEILRVRQAGEPGAEGRSPLGRWFLLHVPLGVLMLPAVGNALVRSTTHAARPGPSQVLDDLAFLVVGTEGSGTVAGRAIAVLVVVALAVTALRVPRSRPLVAGVLAAPVAVMLIASYVMDPMWNRRSLAFVQPFIGVALSLGLARLCASTTDDRPMPRRLAPIAGTAAVVLGAYAVLHVARSTKEQDFRAAAAAIRERLPDGGTVFVPQFVDFWAINRYLVGPDWGSPLVVQANERSERWDSIVEKLGPERAERLGLVGETTRTRGGAYDVVIGPIYDPVAVERRPVLLVHSDELPPEHRARLTMFTRVDEAHGLVFGTLDDFE